MGRVKFLYSAFYRFERSVRKCVGTNFLGFFINHPEYFHIVIRKSLYFDFAEIFRIHSFRIYFIQKFIHIGMRFLHFVEDYILGHEKMPHQNHI